MRLLEKWTRRHMGINGNMYDKILIFIGVQFNQQNASFGNQRLQGQNLSLRLRRYFLLGQFFVFEYRDAYSKLYRKINSKNLFCFYLIYFYYASCSIFESQLSEMKDYIQPPKTYKRQYGFRVRITEAFSDSHARGVKFYLVTPLHLMVGYRTFNPAR